ncbi:3533_t:CDS:2, partial [Cetraspora pellucida]
GRAVQGATLRPWSRKRQGILLAASYTWAMDDLQQTVSSKIFSTLMYTANEVGREFANRYGGLFSEKDWKCPICSNINWARRPECNQCKTPKPGLETTMGSREGRGGGFMERDEVVEYRRSRDAEKDEEWDEFGRKRKKNRDGGVNNNGSDDTKGEHAKEETNGKKDNQNKSNDDREQSKKPSSRSISRDRMKSRSKSRDRKKSEIDSRYYRLRSRSRERDLNKERGRRKTHRSR